MTTSTCTDAPPAALGAIGRTTYRPGASAPPQAHTEAQHANPVLDPATGTTRTWNIVRAVIYRDWRATIGVVPNTPPELPGESIIQVDAVLTADGFILSESSSVEAALAAATQKVLHDVEGVSFHLHTCHRQYEEAIDAHWTTTDVAAWQMWMKQLRLSAEVFTVTDRNIRTAAFHAVRAGYVGTLDDLLTAVSGAMHPAET